MSRRILRIALLVTVIPTVAGAWGFATHRKLTSRLHEPLPEGCLKSFVSLKQSYAFQDDSCDPDRWRETDELEWPRHFLQSDNASPPSSYPREYAAAITLFGESGARSNGQVPWRVEEKYAELVESFRSKNETRVLASIAHLSHYVTDAFSPLHDSFVTDSPVGMHSRFETQMLSNSTQLNTLANEARAFYGTLGRAHPRDSTFEIIFTGQPLALQIQQADLDSAGDTDALLAATRGLTVRRFGDALTLLSSLVASAWVDAGSPLLPSMSSDCSAVVPQGQLELLGHPLPKPVDPTDPTDPMDPGNPGNPPTPPVTPQPGTGCTSAAGALAFPAALLLAFSLRRRRASGR